MPATVVLFRDVDRPPGRIFLDTSFIIALIEWAAHPEQARCAASHDFYQKARNHNSRIWTTPYAAEEILWNYVRHELHLAMARFNVQTISEFKQKHRDEYERTLFGCAPHLQVMIRALNRLRISFEFPGDQAAMRGDWGQQVWRLASQLLDRFPLETADAFHIACAWAGGTGDIASLDDAFKAVDGFTIYCHV